jgi:hypothetical protein
MDDLTDAEYLVALAKSRPTGARWDAIVETVDDLSDADPDAYAALEPALLDALSSWPDHLRACPEHWWEVVQDGNLPWGWELTRKLTPGQGSELDQGDPGIYANLTHLDLSRLPGIPGNDVMYEEVGDFINLTHLDVCGTGVVTFDVVSHITSLREVVAYGCHRLEDLSALRLTGLTHLELSPVDPELVHQLARLTTLEVLEVDHGTWTPTLAPLANLTRLTHLRLNGLDGLERLDGVETLTRLTSLIVSRAALTDAEALRDHPSIERAAFWECPDVSGPTYDNIVNSGKAR